jgi:hypothetical protein
MANGLTTLPMPAAAAQNGAMVPLVPGLLNNSNDALWRRARQEPGGAV